MIGPAQIQLTIDPARVGTNLMHLYLLEPTTGAQWDEAEEVRVKLVQRDEQIELGVDARKGGPGHYIVDGSGLQHRRHRGADRRPRVRVRRVREDDRGTDPLSSWFLIRLFAAVALAAALAVPAAVAAALCRRARPGRSLGGIELGATKAQVERQWGRAYGIRLRARDLVFQLLRLPAARRRRRVAERHGGGVFTIYQPLGWRTRKGLELGDPARRVTALYGPLEVVGCRATPPTCCAGGGRRPPSTS